MTRKLRVILVAGPHAGVGKTFVTCGLAKTLRERGERVEVFREGPDLQPCCPSQDPLYLSSGSTPSSLDGWLLGSTHLQQYLAQRCSSACTVALIDSSLGLWDAAAGIEDPQFCAAQVAKTLGASTLLVIDQCASTNSVVALLRGYVGFDPELKICGVVCNRAEHSINRCILQAAASAAGLDTCILGALPKVDFPPSQADEFVSMAASFVSNYMDVDQLLKLAMPSTLNLVPNGDRLHVPRSPAEAHPRVAVAEDVAFHCSYPENASLLALAGAEVVTFSPLYDTCLPDYVAALVLGAGHISAHSTMLASNGPMLASVRAFAQAGGLIYAESAGLSYLSSSVQLVDGGVCTMAGVFPFCSAFTSSKARCGYVEVSPQQPGFCSLLPALPHQEAAQAGRGGGGQAGRSHGRGQGGRGGQGQSSLVAAAQGSGTPSPSLRGWYHSSTDLLDAPRQAFGLQQQQQQQGLGQEQQRQLGQDTAGGMEIGSSSSSYRHAFQAVMVESSAASSSSSSLSQNDSGRPSSTSEAWPVGVCTENVLASPVHLHFATVPHLLKAWLARCRLLDVPSITAACRGAAAEAAALSQQGQWELDSWEAQLQVMQQSLVSEGGASAFSGAGSSTGGHSSSIGQQSGWALPSVRTRTTTDSAPAAVASMSQRALNTSCSSPNLRVQRQHLFKEEEYQLGQQQQNQNQNLLHMPLSYNTSFSTLPTRPAAHRRTPSLGDFNSAHHPLGAPLRGIKTWSDNVPSQGMHPKGPNQSQDGGASSSSTTIGKAATAGRNPKETGSKRLQGGGHGHGNKRTEYLGGEQAPTPLGLPSANGRTHAKLIGLSCPLKLSPSSNSLHASDTAATSAGMRLTPQLIAPDSPATLAGMRQTPQPIASNTASAASRPHPRGAPVTGPLLPLSTAASPTSAGTGTPPRRVSFYGAISESFTSPQGDSSNGAPTGQQRGAHSSSTPPQVSPNGAAAGQLHGLQNSSTEPDRSSPAPPQLTPSALSPSFSTSNVHPEASTSAATHSPPSSAVQSRHSSQGSLVDLEQRQSRAHALAEERLQELKHQQRQAMQMRLSVGGTRGGQSHAQANYHLIHAAVASAEGLVPLPDGSRPGGGTDEAIPSFSLWGGVQQGMYRQHHQGYQGAAGAGAYGAGAGAGAGAGVGPGPGAGAYETQRKSTQLPAATSPRFMTPPRASFQGPLHGPGQLPRSASSIGLSVDQCSIVSLSAGATETLVAMGLSQRISGIADDIEHTLAADVLRDKPVVCKSRVRMLRQLQREEARGMGVGMDKDTAGVFGARIGCALGVDREFASMLASTLRVGLDCGAAGSSGDVAPQSVETLMLQALHSAGISQWVLHDAGLRASKANLLVMPSMEGTHSADRMALFQSLQESGLLSSTSTGPVGVMILQQSCHTLAGVLDFILQLGEMAAAPQPAALLVDQLRSRLRRLASAISSAVQQAGQHVPRTVNASRPSPRTSSASAVAAAAPRVLVLSSLAPFMQAGLWLPDMLSLLLPSAPTHHTPSARSLPTSLHSLEPGDPHRQLSWDQIRAMAPDVLIIANDPFDEALGHMAHVAGLPGWWSVPAVHSGRVFLVQEGYLMQPGPRLVDGVELMARILHPELVPVRRTPKAAVLKFSLQGGQRCRRCLTPNYFVPWPQLQP